MRCLSTRGLLQCALVLLACTAAACVTPRASAPRGRAVIACLAGDTTEDPFCGARVGSPSAVLCALPGRTAREAFMGSGKIGARLADSSIIEADADLDSLAFRAYAAGAITRVDPCALRLASLERRWISTGDTLARLRLATVAAQLAAVHGASAVIRCSVREDRRTGASYRREATGAGLRSLIDLQAYRSTDQVEAQNYEYEQRYLATLKIDLSYHPPRVADTAVVRSRFQMRALLQPFDETSAGAFFESAATDSGSDGCARLARQAFERMRIQR